MKKTNTILDTDWKLDRDLTIEEREKLCILADAAGLKTHQRENPHVLQMWPSMCSGSAFGLEKCDIAGCRTEVRRDNTYTYDQIIDALKEIIKNNPYVYED